MLKKLTQTFKDMGTIKTLCEAAERIANVEHQKAPGAEHFVLAALELPDGSAARVFDRLGITAEAFRDALRQGHREALAMAGVDPEQAAGSEQDVPPLPQPAGAYGAAPSGASVLQGLAGMRKRGVSGPLAGVHVLDVVSAMQHGTTMRALARLGRDAQTVRAAIAAETVIAA